MKQRIRLLSLTAGTTIVLLTLAGALIVVGIFNESLHWDIFGPKIEALLYGVFGSSIALACVGVAMTVVLGIQEIVKAFRSLQQQRSHGDTREIEEASKGMYAKYMLYVGICLAVLITLLAFLNHGVQNHRSAVFKRLVAEQMAHFQGKLSELLAPLSVPPRDHVSYDLYDLIKTLDNLSFVDRTTLYLSDPNDPSAMWGYTAWRKYEEEDGFSKFFVAKEFEKAMAEAIAGNNKDLEELNNKMGFTWYFLVTDEKGRPMAILRIDGNARENFREYLFGS